MLLWCAIKQAIHANDNCSRRSKFERNCNEQIFFYFQYHCNTQKFSEITVKNPDFSTNSKTRLNKSRKSKLVRGCSPTQYALTNGVLPTAGRQNFANQLSRNGSSITGNRDMLSQY
jgi:hypothetical protein